MASSLETILSEQLSQRAQRSGPARMGDPRASADRISFLAGYPDPEALPVADIIESTRVSLEQDGKWALQYGNTTGYPGLIAELVTKLGRDQGIEATKDNILITNGASQALALIVDLLVDPGDVILSEAPTWSGAVHNFKASGAEVRTIPIDEQGLDVDAVERELKQLKAAGKSAKFLYFIPTFQNPTGYTTTLERRKKIAELAKEYNLPIVEDDAYYDLRYAGETLPTVYSLDSEGLVMYLGTFSKIMSAGMRLGWVVAHPDVINRLTGLKTEGGTSPFAGHVAAEFCGSGTLVEHIGELRSIYLHRRDTMLAALEQHMPEGVSWTVPEGGFFVWVTFPESVSVTKMLAAAKEQNVEFLPGPAVYHAGEGDNQLRLSYSFTDEEQINEGIRILAELAQAQQG